MNKTQRTTSWIGQVLAAVILGQTLFFKFSAAPESVAIFSTLGAEPWGRIGSGIAELVAVCLLLVPRTAALGGLLTLGIMSGAIASHVFVLGIEVDGDGGALFTLALVAFSSAAAATWLRRAELPVLGPRLARLGA